MGTSRDQHNMDIHHYLNFQLRESLLLFVFRRYDNHMDFWDISTVLFDLISVKIHMVIIPFGCYYSMAITIRTSSFIVCSICDSTFVNMTSTWIIMTYPPGFVIFSISIFFRPILVSLHNSGCETDKLS